MYNLGPAFKTTRTVFVTFAVRPKNMDVNTNCKEQLCFLKLELRKKNRIQPPNCSGEYRSVWNEDHPGKKKEEYIESNMLDLDTNLNGEYV